MSLKKRIFFRGERNVKNVEERTIFKAKTYAEASKGRWVSEGKSMVSQC